MFATAIDRADQRRNSHAALAGNLLKTVPELVFDTDTRFVARNDDLAFQSRRHSFLRHE
jgi:hypothetical protein